MDESEESNLVKNGLYDGKKRDLAFLNVNKNPNYDLESLTAGVKEEIVEANYKGRNKYMIVKTTKPAYMSNREFFETSYRLFPIKGVKIVRGKKLYRIV